MSEYHLVKHNCGYEYKALLKKRGSLYTNTHCPKCVGHAKSKELSLLEVLSDLKDANLELVSDYQGRSKEHRLRCGKCGIIFISILTKGKIQKCPYCTGGRMSTSNLYERYVRICKDNLLKPLFSEGEVDRRNRANKEYYRVLCERCGTEYETFFNGSQVVNCPGCIKRKFRSKLEVVIEEYLVSKGIRVYSNYRNMCLREPGKTRGFELDLYLPDYNLAIEFDGSAYHNTGYVYSKPRGYHKMKTEVCLENGIRLLHFRSGLETGLIKSILCSKLGLLTKIYARKCKLVEITSNEAKEFLTYNHVDGFVRSSFYYALVTDRDLRFKCEAGSIACVFTLMKRQTQSDKKSHWEIGRFATQRGYTVVGGYSKVLKYAIEYLKSVGETELVSYCNRDLSPDPNNTFYSKQGFEFTGDSGMIYYYWNPRRAYFNGSFVKGDTIMSRYLFQKNKLIVECKEQGIEVLESDTEYSLAEKLGFYPCFNSGNFKYVLHL